MPERGPLTGPRFFMEIQPYPSPPKNSFFIFHSLPNHPFLIIYMAVFKTFYPDLFFPLTSIFGGSIRMNSGVPVRGRIPIDNA